MSGLGRPAVRTAAAILLIWSGVLGTAGIAARAAVGRLTHALHLPVPP